MTLNDRSTRTGRSACLTDTNCSATSWAILAIDRVAADRPFYSGKHRKHGMNLQVIASPDGDIVWVSGPLPGAAHDLTAARIWGIVQALAACGLVVLGDKGYIGEDDIRTPYRGRNKPASQKEANRAHARLRAPGERANAQLKSWRILRKLRCCPGAPDSSPKRFTSFKPAKSEDEKG
jgi:DDE superfamily endonuclease